MKNRSTPTDRPISHRRRFNFKRPRTITLVLATALVIMFIIAVSGRNAAPAAAPAPAPSPIVQTKTVEVEVVPDACLDALRAADTGFDLASKALGYAGEGITAMTQFDYDAVDAATSKLTDVNGEITNLAPQYTTAREECRAAAK